MQGINSYEVGFLEVVYIINEGENLVRQGTIDYKMYLTIAVKQKTSTYSIR